MRDDSPPAGMAIYLAGDSFPAASHVEDRLRERFGARFRAWIGQRALLEATGEERFETAIAHRQALLGRIAAAHAGPGPMVLFGRSSGARVATLFAMRGPVDAVVCLGYPFRRPHAPPEPDRVAHLARLATPTLIVQGQQDPYAAASGAGTVLSRSIATESLDCDHEFRLSRAEWDRLGLRIDAFLRPVLRGR